MSKVCQSQSNLNTSNVEPINQNLVSIELKTTAPIGLFDSGVGGLSVYLHLRQMLPNEHYIYYADTLHVPYGERSFDDIEQLTLSAVAWLVAAGCKLIIIACNTASTHSLDSLRLQYPHIPIVGLVPALKPAVLLSKTKQVAVLATKATLEGKLLNQVIADYATPYHITVQKWSDPNLVPWVESGMLDNSPVAVELINTLHKMVQAGVDYVVLGCTHYPFFRPFLQKYIDEHKLPVTLIDSGQAIASRVHDLLVNHCLQIGNINLCLENKTSDDFGVANAVKVDVTGEVASAVGITTKLPKLRFFSTKNEPHLKTLVKRLVDDNDGDVYFLS